jgi:hypothetical protein
MWQSHCFRHGGRSNGGHIVDSDHRIDRVMPGEFDYGPRGRLWISNIEQQDIVRRHRETRWNPFHANGHSNMEKASCIEKRVCSISRGGQEEE